MTREEAVRADFIEHARLVAASLTETLLPDAMKEAGYRFVFDESPIEIKEAGADDADDGRLEAVRHHGRSPEGPAEGGAG